MLMKGKVPSQAQSSSSSTAIVVALAVIILLVLASVTLGPILLPSTDIGEEQWLIGP